MQREDPSRALRSARGGERTPRRLTALRSQNLDGDSPARGHRRRDLPRRARCRTRHQCRCAAVPSGTDTAGGGHGDRRVDVVGAKDVRSGFVGIAATHRSSAGRRWRRSRQRAASRTSSPTSQRPTARWWRCGRTVPAARRGCGGWPSGAPGASRARRRCSLPAIAVSVNVSW